MSLLLRFSIICALAWLSFLCAKVIRLWFRAKMLDVPVPLVVLIRLELGKVGAGPVLDSYIAGRRGDLDVTLGELEQLSVLGGNPRAVIQEMISAKASGQPLLFKDAANKHLASQPGKLIRLKRNQPYERGNGEF